jgi:NADH dehydrogenase FAD-containing subunit
MQTSEDREVKNPIAVPKVKVVFPDDEGTTDEKELTLKYQEESAPSIENELLLKKFIKEINKKDRGLDIEEEIDEDFGETLGLIIDKTFDTLGDIRCMFNRMMKEKEIRYDPDTLEEWNENLPNKPRVLVIGSGWASHALIKCLDSEKYRSLVVSPTNYFVFTPMLASTSVGTTETRSIIEATRDSNPFSRYLEGRVLDFDLEQKIARVRLGEGDIMDVSDDSGELIDIPYDICVYAVGVGPISSSFRTPGLSKDNVYFLKTINDAKKLKRRVIDLLEQASQPGLSDEKRRKILTFVVVGAGPTGVEYVGELCDFLEDVTSKGGRGINRGIGPFANLANLASVKLIQGNKDLLPMFDKGLRESAKTGLMEKGVDVMTSTKVSRIEGKDKIVVSKESGESEIDCGIIVWAAGTKQLKVTESVMNNLDEYAIKQDFESKPSQLSVRGRIPVDKWLRVISTPPGSMLAMGDAACPIDSEELPQNAQVAAQQGAYIARLLNREYDLAGDGSYDKVNLCLGPPINRDAEAGDSEALKRLRGRVKAKPFQFLNLGQLAYTGGGEALSQVQLGNKRLFSQAGSVSFLLWRSVYIVKQVSAKTRLLVLFDWFKTKIFGRDVTRM